MFPIYGGKSGFTYDNLREVRLDPLWTILASTLAAAFLVLMAFTTSGQPPVQAGVPDADTAFVEAVGADYADAVVAVP